MQSVSDSLFPIELVDGLVEKYCSKGANIFVSPMALSESANMVSLRETPVRRTTERSR
jgi:hypothetical protein